MIDLTTVDFADMVGGDDAGAGEGENQGVGEKRGTTVTPKWVHISFIERHGGSIVRALHLFF